MFPLALLQIRRPGSLIRAITLAYGKCPTAPSPTANRDCQPGQQYLRGDHDPGRDPVYRLALRHDRPGLFAVPGKDLWRAHAHRERDAQGDQHEVVHVTGDGGYGSGMRSIGLNAYPTTHAAKTLANHGTRGSFYVR